MALRVVGRHVGRPHGSVPAQEAVVCGRDAEVKQALKECVKHSKPLAYHSLAL